MLRNRLHQSPCNGDLPVTPNQLRFRAPSHKDLSTTNSSGFTPDFELFRNSSTYNSLNSTHPPVYRRLSRRLPTSEGLGYRALKAFAIYPSDRARVSRQSVAIFLLFLFFFLFIFSFLSFYFFFFWKTHWPSFNRGP